MKRCASEIRSTSHGIIGLHAWTFAAVPEGIHVSTEESWSGAPVDADAANLQAALDGSLVSWLAHLTAQAERFVTS